MSLRKTLGADADRVHQQLDAVLDSEDGMIILVDGSRATSYTHGFGISPCQLEFADGRNRKGGPKCGAANQQQEEQEKVR